ncbi:MAG: hypothetical protein WAN42_24585, partial [Pseudolabrys sp.]
NREFESHLGVRYCSMAIDFCELMLQFHLTTAPNIRGCGCFLIATLRECSAVENQSMFRVA